MPETLTIRSAVEADAAALLAIYRPFVESTAVSFETVVPAVEEFATRIAKALAVGSGSSPNETANALATRMVFAPAASRLPLVCRGSAYVHPNHHRRAWSRALSPAPRRTGSKRFLQRLRGHYSPDEGSVALTGSGFEFIGVFRRWPQFGTWHDVAWFQRVLRDSPPSG